MGFSAISVSISGLSEIDELCSTERKQPIWMATILGGFDHIGQVVHHLGLKRPTPPSEGRVVCNAVTMSLRKQMETVQRKEEP